MRQRIRAPRPDGLLVPVCGVNPKTMSAMYQRHELVPFAGTLRPRHAWAL